MNLAKDVFLLSFGLMGMNAVDLFECTDYEGGYLNYNRTKTKNRRADAARMVVKVHPDLMPLFEKYRDKTGKRVFCFYQYYSEANTFSAAINKGLKKIGEKIGIADFEFYAARHTWATLATNKVGIAKDLVHEALNHVDDKMRITNIYIEKDWRRIDDANKQMLEYVGFSKVNIKEEIYQRKFNKHLPKREHPIFSEE
jgi:integrase